MGKFSRTLYRGLIEYETPRLVKVHNVWLGLVIRISQLAVIAYVISYAILYERGYQVCMHMCVYENRNGSSFYKIHSFCLCLSSITSQATSAQASVSFNETMAHR